MKTKVLVFLQLFRRLLPWKQEKPFVYVAIGDSTVEGIGATTKEKAVASLLYAFFRRKKKQVTYYNFGKIHSRIQEVIDQQLPQVLEKDPDIVVLAVGANDIRFRTSLRTFAQSLAYLVQTLREQTHAVLVINLIPDLSLLTIFPYYVRIYCKWIVRRFNKQIAFHMQDNVMIIDTYTASKRMAQDKALLAGDGIHPSDLGYAAWAQQVISEISHVFFPSGEYQSY